MRENGQEKDINLFMYPYPSIYNTACVLMEEEDNQWTAVQVNVAFCCHYEPEAMTTSLAGVWKPSRTLGPAPVAPAAAGPTLKPPHATSLSLSLPLYFASQPAKHISPDSTIPPVDQTHFFRQLFRQAPPVFLYVFPKCSTPFLPFVSHLPYI